MLHDSNTVQRKHISVIILYNTFLIAADEIDDHGNVTEGHGIETIEFLIIQYVHLGHLATRKSMRLRHSPIYYTVFASKIVTSRVE